MSKLISIIKTIPIIVMNLIFILKKLKPEIIEVVKVIEQKALDGVLDVKDRKEIAMKAILEISEKCGKKLDVFERIVVSKIIDKVAARLPMKDIKVPEIIQAYLKTKKRKKTAKKIKSTKKNFTKK